MPSSFSYFEDGDAVRAEHVMQLHDPVNNLERGAAFYAGSTSGTSTAYTATLDPAPDDPYPEGLMVNLKIHTANGSGSPDVTLNLNSVGAKPIVKNGGSSLSASDMAAGQIVTVVYDSAGSGSFQLIGKY